MLAEAVLFGLVPLSAIILVDTSPLLVTSQRFGSELLDVYINLQIKLIIESLASCLANQFRCTNNGKCISGNLRCDGLSNCQNGEDEVGCSEF